MKKIDLSKKSKEESKAFVQLAKTIYADAQTKEKYTKEVMLLLEDRKVINNKTLNDIFDSQADLSLGEV